MLRGAWSVSRLRLGRHQGWALGCCAGVGLIWLWRIRGFGFVDPFAKEASGRVRISWALAGRMQENSRRMLTGVEPQVADELGCAAGSPGR